MKNDFQSIDKNMPSKTKAVIYARFSSDSQHEASIDAQKRFTSIFAAQNNYEIVNCYCDRAKSGKSMNRPAFQQMMEDSKTGQFQAIIVHKLDRFSRNTVDTLSAIEELKDRGVEVISAYERIENTPMGELMLKIISGMSEYYIRNLANEVLKGQKENAYKCKANGGIGCLGYNIVNQKYVVNEQEAETVRLIFQMYSEGYGYNSILDKLNNLGYRTKAGKPFGKNSLYEILNNEKYVGIYTFNKIARCNSHGVRNSHRLKPDSEIIKIPNGVPAIISQELWDRTQAIRKINPKGRSHNKYFYLLSGLVWCGLCGGKLSGNPRNPGNGRPVYVTYRCNCKNNNRSCCCRKIRREYIEVYVIEELFRHFFNDDSIPMITKQLNEKIRQSKNDKDEEYLQYKGTLQLLNKSRANLMDAITQGGFNKSIGDKLKDVESQIERCEAFLRESDERSSKISPVTEEQVRQSLGQLKEFAKHSEKEEIRAMVQSYVERVTVYNDRVEVTYKVAFPSSTKEPLTYNCDSAISRNNLERFGNQRLLSEKSEKMVKALHSA